MRYDPNPATAELLSSASDAAAFLKSLANPNRLMIVCALIEGERSVRDLEDTLGIRQPGLSQQLAELRSAGLVTPRKVSKSVFYRLADERVAALVGVLYGMFCEGRMPARIDPTGHAGNSERTK